MWLVTGGAGFIGSHIVHRLVRDGQKVRVLDNLATGHREKLDDIVSRIDFVEGDVRDEPTVRNAMRDVTVIIHLAAQPSVPAGEVLATDHVFQRGSGEGWAADGDV